MRDKTKHTTYRQFSALDRDFDIEMGYKRLAIHLIENMDTVDFQRLFKCLLSRPEWCSNDSADYYKDLAAKGICEISVKIEV